MHIYHYGSYEPSRLKQLAGRHATEQDELDDLLRGRVFVDLYRVVRQGVLVGAERYSIKNLEPIYGFTREINLRDAGSSIVEFEKLLEFGRSQRRAQGADRGLQQGRHGLDREAARLARGATARSRAQAGRGAAASAEGRSCAHGEGVRPGSRRPRARSAADWLGSPRSWPIKPNSTKPHGSSPTCSNGTGARTSRPGGATRPDVQVGRRTDRGGRADRRAGVRETWAMDDRLDPTIYRYRFPPQELQDRRGDSLNDPQLFAAEEKKTATGSVEAIDDDKLTIDIKRGRRMGRAAPEVGRGPRRVRRQGAAGVP